MRCTALSLLCLATLLTACSPSQVPTVCRAGETLSCACQDGRSGAQRCAEDGSRFDACLCAGEGQHDAGHADAGAADAGHDDGGPADAGAADAGRDDGGIADAGTADAGHDDAGADDAGLGDAGLSYVLPADCNGSVVVLESGVQTEGSIGALNDIDCFLIAAPAHSVVVVALTTEENLDLELYDATGQRIAASEGEPAVEEVATTTGSDEVFIAMVDPYSDAIGDYGILFSLSPDEGKDFGSAVPVDIDTTVDGAIQLPEDTDYFRIEVGAGILRVTLEPIGAALSLSLYSPDEDLLMHEEGEGSLQITSAVTTPGFHYAVVAPVEGVLDSYTLQVELLDD